MRLGRGYIEILLYIILCGHLGKEEEEEGRGSSRVVVFITYNN
jgi:hypothetical protein